MATTIPTNPMRQEDSLKNKGQEAINTIGEKAKDAAQSVADRARDAAHNVGDKARDTAQSVADRTRDAVSNLGSRAEEATHNVGKGMESLAGTLREKMPQQGVLGSASSRVADCLDSTGRYVEEEGLKGMADDMTNLIRKNPIPAVLVGVGLGYLIARVTSRS